MNRLHTVSLGLVAGLLICAGCTRVDPPRFKLNFEGKDRQDLTNEQQQALVDSMEALFGTPDDPFVFPETGLDLKLIRMASGPASTSSHGEQHGLYRKHCVHCHGVTGDGVGPTALFLQPYPRDYRLGVFKFTSTAQGMPPTTADIRRVIVDGIMGTAMPSFALLPDDEIDALTEYVRYLAIRGQTETLVYDYIVNQEETPTKEGLIENCLTPVVDMWNQANDSVVTPPAMFFTQADADQSGTLSRDEVATWIDDNFGSIDTDGDGQVSASEQATGQIMPDPPITVVKNEKGEVVSMDGDTNGDQQVSKEELSTFVLDHFKQSDLDGDESVNESERLAASIEAGRQLFQNAKAQCVKCHGPTGLGDGGGEALLDDWNKQKKDLPAHLFALPKQELKPRNLRLGYYRGGRRPVDLYRRVHAGIKGAQMPGAGPAEGNTGTLKSEEIWHLVEYVLSLPYDSASQSHPPQASASVK